MNQPQQHHRRRQHLIDKKVQGQFLTALVIIEVLIFALGMMMVYQDMQAVMEDNLYRVHQHVQGGRPLLLKQLLLTVPWIIGVNIVLLIIADRIWQRNVQVIVAELQAVLEKVRKLDLRGYHVHGDQHEVLQQAEHWFGVERERYHQLHTGVHQLPEQLEDSDQHGVTQLRNQLNALREHLPKA